MAAIPPLGRYIKKEFIWPVIFWSWALIASLGIEWSAVNDPSARPSTPDAYSDISFRGLTFEQLDETNRRVTLHSIDATFDNENKEFVLNEPELTWRDPARTQVFSATGGLGRFHVATDISNLPSEFQQIEFLLGAAAHSGDTTVDAERLVFDNTTLLFEIPGIYTMKKQGAFRSRAGNPDSSIYFDPLLMRMGSNRDELIANRQTAQQPQGQ
ncbi:MAG: hypothetical protein GC154_12630 [bacterium]|nr:hypothetical protein [bacterium]